MAYSVTGIHGISLVANGEVISAFGGTVPYGADCSLSVWTSLASDAPEAGIVTLTVLFTRPDASQFSATYTDSVNPGDPCQFLIPVASDMAGNWAVTFSLTASVPGTEGIMGYDAFWDVSQPSELELQPGDYIIETTVTNLSTSGGGPVPAILRTQIEYRTWYGYYGSFKTTGEYEPNESKVHTFNLSISPDQVGDSGTIEVSVLDPYDNELARTSLAFSII